MSDKKPLTGYAIEAEMLRQSEQCKAESSLAAPPGSADREYWLYVWGFHPWFKDERPAEYSAQPVIIKTRDLLEALSITKQLADGAAKWELYEGSGWSGNPPVATYCSTIKPPNYQAH